MSPKVQVARTIVEQLGGNRFIAMTGANSFVATDKGVRFKLPKYPGLRINAVEIDLNAGDLYDVRFLRRPPLKAGTIGQLPVELIDSAGDVFCDQLRAVFERATGLATSLTGRAT